MLWPFLHARVGQYHARPTTYVDTAFGASVIAAMALSASAYRSLGAGNLTWHAVPALVCALGLSMATKGTGPILAALYCVILFAGVCVGWFVAKRSGLRPVLTKGVFFCAATVGVMLAVGGYWMAPSRVIGGSPLFPMGVTFAVVEVHPREPGTVHHLR